MLKERLIQLFADCDPTIQALISEVLTLEQIFITMDRPRLKDDIDQIVTRLAGKELEQVDKETEESRSLFS